MSVLSIWNRALSAANARGSISSPSENSPEAEVCRLWYPQILQSVQCAAWWPGSRAFSRLALVYTASGTWTDTQPEPGFSYAYVLPSNLLRPWHLSDFSRFNMAYNGPADAVLLHSNTPQAILIYGMEQQDVSKWTAQQRDATSFALAAAIAPQLTGRDTLVKRNYELANLKLEEARASAHTDIGDEQKRVVPWFAARGFGPPQVERYLYPYGELFPYAQ